MAIAAKKPVRVIAIDGALRDAVVKAHPEFFATTIKGGVYNGQPTAVETLGSALFWVTYDGFSNDAAYTIVKSILTYVREADVAHPSIKDIKVETALDGVTTPMNPGARKFFEEIKAPKLANIPQ